MIQSRGGLWMTHPRDEIRKTLEQDNGRFGKKVKLKEKYLILFLRY